MSGSRIEAYMGGGEEGGNRAAEVPLTGLRVWREGSVRVGELLRVEVCVFPHTFLDVSFDLRGENIFVFTSV